MGHPIDYPPPLAETRDRDIDIDEDIDQDRDRLDRDEETEKRERAIMKEGKSVRGCVCVSVIHM